MRQKLLGYLGSRSVPPDFLPEQTLGRNFWLRQQATLVAQPISEEIEETVYIAERGVTNNAPLATGRYRR